MPHKSFFGESTVIPVSFVMTIIGITIWFATIAARTDALADALTEMQARNLERDRLAVEVLQKLERIETRVDYIYESAVKQNGKK